MQLTYKNATRISYGIIFIISVFWWMIFELPLGFNKNRFNIQTLAQELRNHHNIFIII